jgi:hypothetical protein
MKSILKILRDFFAAETTNYAHRERSIEIIAQEKGIDIDSIIAETETILENKGRVEAIENLRHRFHLPLAAAWRFVDKLDNR